MSLINIKKLYLAKVNETPDGETFDTPEYVPGVQKFDAKIKTNTAQNYEEGVLVEQDNTLQNVDISFDIGHMDNAQIAKYLGHHVAANGGVYAEIDDVAPYVALLYEYEKGNHKLGYKVYYKGMLSEPDEGVKQKEGKTDYQNHTVTASFQPLVGHGGKWKYTVEQDDANCPADIATAFFNNVIIPDEDTTVPTVASVPADAAIGVAADSDIVFTFSTAMNSSTINSNNLFLAKADGTAVATTLTLDTTKKIATMHPTVALSTGSYIAFCSANAKSISGVQLATNVIVNFTV